MQLRRALAPFVIALLGGSYAAARMLVPQGVYVWISLEDHQGRPIQFEYEWGETLYSDFGTQELRPGLVIDGTDDIEDPGRSTEMKRWHVTDVTGRSRVSFLCRPGARAAFACLDHELGTDEVVLDLPDVRAWFPWKIEFVTLRLPGKAGAAKGELELTVLDADGSTAEWHPSLRLASPVGRLPLVYSFGETYGHSSGGSPSPARLSLPPGAYRVEMDQHAGIFCGNGAPIRDNHLPVDLLVDVAQDTTTKAVVERRTGVHLDLEIAVEGAGDRFQEDLLALVEEWERHHFDGQPPITHPLSARASIQPLTADGSPTGPARPYECGWRGCKFIGPRTSFPLVGSVYGIEHFAPGPYRLRVEGLAMEPVELDLELRAPELSENEPSGPPQVARIKVVLG